mgnify:CR=1 FL=1
MCCEFGSLYREEMKKIRVLCLFFIFSLILTLPGSVYAIDEASIKRIAVNLGDYFVPVETKVVKVEGDSAILDGGIEKGILPGMVLSVSRGGYPFYHPITGVFLGYAEKYIGFAQVYVSGNNYSIARLYTKENVKPGDTVRITKSKVVLYLFPPINRNIPGFNIFTFYSRLKDELSQTGRFNILSDESTFHFASRGIVDPEFILQYIKKYGNYTEPVYALTGVVYEKGGEYVYNATLLSLNIGKKIRDFVFVLGKKSETEEITSDKDVVLVSQFIEGKALSVCAGHLEDKNSKNVVVFIEGKVLIFRVDQDRLIPVFEDTISPVFNPYTCDCVDLDGDGIDEIVLSGADLSGFTIESDILKFTGKKLKNIRKANDFVRFYDLKNKKIGFGQILLSEDPLAEPPYTVSYRNGSLVKGKEVDHLKGILILGLNLFEIGDGLYFVTNNEGRVVVKDGKGNLVSDIVGQYGNRGNAFFFKEPKERRYYYGFATNVPTKDEYSTYKDYTLTVPGRSVFLISGNNRYLVLFRNNPFQWGAYFEAYSAGLIHAYRWNGSFFEDSGFERVVPEGIVDLYAFDVDGDGNDEVVVLATKPIKTTKKGTNFITRVYIYKVK